MGCSICGAEGVTKQTCPFNAESTKSKPRKHNPIPLPGSGTKNSSALAIMQPAGPKIKARIKAHVGAEAGFSMAAVEEEARRLFPENLGKQHEYAADVLSLELPDVPQYDAVSKMHRQQQEKLKQARATMADRCQRCLKAIRLRGMLKDSDWFTASRLCTDCHQQIGKLYHNSDFKESYKRYHPGTELPVEQLLASGPTNNYYNATMHDGAKFWAEAASHRAVKALPNVPRGPLS
jgi:hypothetical protein